MWPSIPSFPLLSTDSALFFYCFPSQVTSLFGVQISVIFLQVQISWLHTPFAQGQPLWVPAMSSLRCLLCPVSPWVSFSRPSPRAISSKILFPPLFLIPNRDAGCWLGAPSSSNTWWDWFIYRQESIRVCNNQGRRAREALSAFPCKASTGNSSGFKCGHHSKGPGCTVASFSGKVSTKREGERGILWYHTSRNCPDGEWGREAHWCLLL